MRHASGGKVLNAWHILGELNLRANHLSATCVEHTAAEAHILSVFKEARAGGEGGQDRAHVMN